MVATWGCANGWVCSQGHTALSPRAMETQAAAQALEDRALLPAEAQRPQKFSQSSGGSGSHQQEGKERKPTVTQSPLRWGMGLGSHPDGQVRLGIVRTQEECHGSVPSHGVCGDAGELNRSEERGARAGTENGPKRPASAMRCGKHFWDLVRDNLGERGQEWGAAGAWNPSKALPRLHLTTTQKSRLQAASQRERGGREASPWVCVQTSEGPG